MLSTHETIRTVRIAAVQMTSQDGAIAANLEHATQLVEEAARNGAELILLPEFMSTGYLWEKRIWQAAEPKDGPTGQWLCETSARLGVWLGASFLETDGRDFFNSFVLTTCDGREAGRVRKQFPSIGEAFFFKGEASSHVIETAIGKIGVAICFDAHTVHVARILSTQSIDLMLIPHSYAIPAEPSGSVSSQDLERMKDNLRGIAPYYAQLCGVPAVSVNKCGPAHAPKPEGSIFPGLAAIVDSDGMVKEQMEGEEGVIVADVTLDPARKKCQMPRAYGRYVYPGPPGRGLLAVIESIGKIWYQLSSDRRKSAQTTWILKGKKDEYESSMQKTKIGEPRP
jgi:N-carbamoylputrescine amidase